MIQVFLNIADHLRRRLAQLQAIEDYADEEERWRRDPLSHPDIAAMTERERADLPYKSLRDACNCFALD